MRRSGFAFTLFLLALPTGAQTPSDHWKTVETAHFRVHYPQTCESWALRAGSRLESIREAVASVVGYAAPQKTDVLVENPEAAPNGLTYPFLDSPRIVLYTEPPAPADEIGEFDEWGDLLAAHEITHLEHLLRPSRNPTRHLLESVFPFGPIPLSAPRWVIEGYATVVEGQLTGAGRPSSSFRAAVLRVWAASGRLPSYVQLSSDRRFFGMSMAYLAGSAYLSWLEERGGRNSLQKLWARMTARQTRSFDEAFVGVFGDSPQRLYGLFTSDLVERAAGANRQTAAGSSEAEPWQDTAGESGGPAVSPDGRQLALVLRNAKGESSLMIYGTGEPTEEQKKDADKIARMIRLDPEDVPPVRSRPLPRKPQHSLVLPLHGGISMPRWLPDGKSILFGHRSVDRRGNRHRDLYRWTIGRRVAARVTRLADVSDADPFSDGKHAVAVRSRCGSSQLVMVDLESGDVAPLTAASFDLVYAHPRARGDRLAFVEHRGRIWQLVIREANGIERRFPDERANVATPEWSRTTDDLFVTLLSGGAIDIHRFSPDGSHAPVIRTTGAAFQPAPSSDGRLFFMSLDPDGFRVRVLGNPVALPARSFDALPFVPALAPRPGPAVRFAPEQLPAEHEYGRGRLELRGTLSGSYAPSTDTTEIGLRAGDVLGRFDALALVALGAHGSQRGETIALVWRGLPVELRAQAYRAVESFASQSAQVSQRGVEVRGVWHSLFETSTVTVEGGGLARQLSSLAFVVASARARQWLTSEELSVGAEAGHSGHVRGRLRGEAELGIVRLGGEVQADRSHGGSKPLDVIAVGGVASSVLPRSALANRIMDPALETGTLIGRAYTGARVDATIGLVTFFHREHRLNRRIDVNGVEYVRKMPPMPLLKLPGFAATIGAARTMGRNRWWLGVRLQP